MFRFLRALGLHPIEWTEATSATSSGTPYVAEILDQAFAQAQAVVVLMTGDDLACLRERFRHRAESADELELTPQARPNVLFEAGMALGRFPDRTILVTLGTLRPFTNIGGRYPVVLKGRVGLKDLRNRLEAAECRIRPKNADWLAVDFSATIRAGKHDSSGSNYPVRWPSTDAPRAESVLGTAAHSLLLVGVSHERVVTGDQEAYKKWLRADSERQMALLFLNPHSPHAVDRQLTPHRGNKSDIQFALKRAVELGDYRSTNLLLRVYDGPSRYSARATDLGCGSKNAHPEITIFTSAHDGGLPNGFGIGLTPRLQPECFAHYEKELLNLWKQAQANPPGHGVSAVVRWRPPLQLDVLERLITRLLGSRSTEDDFVVFAPQHLHVTITSLRRTQSEGARFDGPLAVEHRDPGRTLPTHFPHFVRAVTQSFPAAGIRQLRFSFDRIAIDENGHVVLTSSERHPQVEEVLGKIPSLLRQFAKEYPNERQAWDSGNHAPKYQKWAPHATIGMAFRRKANYLPLPARGHARSIPLARPIPLVAEEISLVHYAYRTLRRCVGEIAVPLAVPFKLSPQDIMRQLAI
jgi:hypothetical protein